MGGASIEGTVSTGISSLFGIAPIVTILVLIILALCWFIKYLLADAKEERKLMREALVGNTAVISEFKEIVRGIKERNS